MVNFFITVVIFLQRALMLVVVFYVVLSYFMDYYHPVRRVLSRILEPFLRPLQRILPSYGNLDFSPLVLIIIIQLMGALIIYLLRSLA